MSQVKYLGTRKFSEKLGKTEGKVLAGVWEVIGLSLRSWPTGGKIGKST